MSELFLSISRVEWLGVILMMFIHEFGHGITASLFNRTVRFSWRLRGPITIHGLYEGEPLTPINKLQLISLSGFLFNVLTTPLMVPLFNFNYLKYLAICIACSLGDFFTIYKRIIKND